MEAALPPTFPAAIVSDDDATQNFDHVRAARPDLQTDPRPMSSVSSACLSVAPSSISPYSLAQSNDNSTQSRRSVSRRENKLPNHTQGTGNPSFPVNERGRKNSKARSELKEWYDRRSRHEIRSNENFVVWNVYNPSDRQPMFTAYFISPNGEYFPAGKLICDEGSYKLCDDDGMHWYAQRKAAIEAASGRAMDYLRFKEAGCPSKWNKSQFCQERPTPRQPTKLPQNPQAKEDILKAVAKFQQHA